MEKERKKRAERGSVLDVFLILLLLGSLVTAGLRIYRSGGAEDASRRAEAVLLAREIRGEIARQIPVGAMLYASDGSPYGKVTQVRIKGSVAELTEGGVSYFGEWDPSLWCDLFLTVEIWGSERDGVFYRNGSEGVLLAARSVLHTRRATLSLKTVSVSVLE